MRITEIHGVTVGEVEAQGALVNSERDATDLIGEAFSQNVELVVIPVSRLGEDFFQLKTRIAGEIAQKFVNYRLRLAVVGDISAYLEESNALRDFVREANRGKQLWFAENLPEIYNRLAPRHV